MYLYTHRYDIYKVKREKQKIIYDIEARRKTYIHVEKLHSNIHI